MKRAMNPLHQPAQIWVHAPASLHRIINSLPDQPAYRQALVTKFAAAKKNGVDGIIVPISWRTVAPFHPDNVEQAQRWQGYLSLFSLIRQAQLKLIPEFNIGASGVSEAGTPHLLPDWFWGKLGHEQPADWPQDSLKYVDQLGNDTISAPSLWARELYTPYVSQWLKAFFHHAAEFQSCIPQILLGAGPDGEVRFPILDALIEPADQHQLGVFSGIAVDSFEQAMLSQYGEKAAWYRAWEVEDDALTANDLLGQIQQQINTLLADNTRSSKPISDFYRWYQSQLITFSAETLSSLSQTLPEQWSCGFGLRVPVSLNASNDHADQHALALAGVALDHETALFSRLFDALSKIELNSDANSLCVLLSGVESTQPHYQMSDWVGRAGELGIQLYVENRQANALDDHLAWDKLMQRSLQQTGVAGWALRDLDSVLDTEQAGAARLRQLGRMKHGMGKVGQQLGRKSFRVMGPLHLKVGNQLMMLQEENWIEFEREIRQLRKIGVSAISTDLWWGLIEGRQPGLFDWTYYDRMVEVLAANEMHWVPILSFHQAGGNVNDDFMQTIPLWLWGKLIENHDELESVRDLQYVSETGDTSMEYVSLWADEYVVPYYRQFMQAFRDHYQDRADLIDEINVSLGPAGELRYPSYNAHDWGEYPNRGTLQCFSRLAEQRWKSHLKQKFKTVKALNYAFNGQHKSFDSVAIPDPHPLFEQKNYLYSSWAREFLTWYQGELIQHGRGILECANDVFSEGAMANVPLGVKVPGIHWEISDPAMPRVAEITAGLVAPHPELGPHNRGEYVKLLGQLVPSHLREKVILHFTCLEMINKDYEGYSRAEDLVNWVADAAAELGISLMGENALAGELYGKQGWQQIARALDRQPGFGGITLLRMQNLFDDHPTPMKELTRLINKAQ
ncbi:hypothetical protein DU002_15840 [Corallincola holothuriorum]|uniref:Beta-amylase n=2 Tax=Corallincola holothuriorum TaxID=2282215 RepID=A0A368N5V4_9GAMM|nr:hypothetical protein DU002_15840 [Corallincola holothuriorum]